MVEVHPAQQDTLAIRGNMSQSTPSASTSAPTEEAQSTSSASTSAPTKEEIAAQTSERIDRFFEMVDDAALDEMLEHFDEPHAIVEEQTKTWTDAQWTRVLESGNEFVRQMLFALGSIQLVVFKEDDAQKERWHAERNLAALWERIEENERLKSEAENAKA